MELRPKQQSHVQMVPRRWAWGYLQISPWGCGVRVPIPHPWCGGIRPPTRYRAVVTMFTDAPLRPSNISNLNRSTSSSWANWPPTPPIRTS